MNESLEAACGRFEQVILGQMLRTAGIGRTTSDDGDDDDARSAQSGDDAFSQLVVQSLAGAIERAGGIGLRPALVAAFEGRDR